MKKTNILFALFALTACTHDDIVEEILQEQKKKQELELSELEVVDNKSNITWPFRYNFLEFNGITKEGLLGWEGEMYDYDNDGIADMVSMGTDIKIVENKPHSKGMYSWKKTIKLSDYIEYDEKDLWTAHGVVHDFNNDGIPDHFVGLVGEGPGGVYNRGGTYLILSEGNSYKGSVVDSRKMFRFDDTFTLIDYNRDGYMDVLTDFEFTVYLNKGDNTFEIIDNPFPRLTTRPGWLHTRVDDLNGDGYNDIIGIAFQGLEIHYGTSDYTKFNSWYKEWQHLEGWMGADVTITNIDNRGYKEILVTYSNWKGQLYTRIFKFDGTDYFMDTQDAFYQLTKSPSWDLETRTTAWDFDKDGDEDIFFQQINEHTNYFFENVNGVLVKKLFE